MHRPPSRLVVPLLAILLVAGCAKSPRSFVAPTSSSARSTIGLHASTLIVTPRPAHQLPIAVPPSFPIAWEPGETAVQGATYLTRLAFASEINPADTLAIFQDKVRAFFQDDLANNRAAWTSTTSTDTALKDQEFYTSKYFAVVALDAAGQPEPADTTFSMDANVLWFRAVREATGPDLSVQSELFNVTKVVTSLDPTPRSEVTIRSGSNLRIEWSALPDIGRRVDGYRWAVDVESVSDESPRRNPNDVEHWSEWDVATTSATIGPFPAGDAKKPAHVFYVEARDNLGGMNLVAISIRLSGKPRSQAPLLVIDDLYGTPTSRATTGVFPIVGGYPMEAEQDSFYCAVGGFPDSLRRFGIPGADPGALSVAGAFAGFEYDTLDYRFWPQRGIDSETLSRYRAVAWYSDPASAVRSGDKFSLTAMTALRQINSAQQVNSLAEYVAAGGKLWLFGSGATSAIANGYWSRIGPGSAPVPYTSGEERGDILKPGNFLYDFVHLRSSLAVAGTVQEQTKPSQLHAAIPYLPQFAGPASQLDRTHDPRIGPSAARTAVHWNDLPRLTIASYRGADPDPALRSFSLSFFIQDPLDLVAGSGKRTESTADTLYLCQARVYDPGSSMNPIASDGKPNAIWYHGGDQGDVVWFGFPLERFELGQVRQVVGAVMRNFGIEPLPAGVRQGPGVVEPPSGTEESSPFAQRLR